MKKIGFICGTLTLIFGLLNPGWTLDQIPGQVDVMFKQGVTLYRQQSGFISCGIDYIDSVNEANELQHLFNVSCGTCELLQKSYIAVFPDSANIAALVSAYLADTANVQWASARYYPDLSFTPNDSFFAKPSPSATPSSYQWPLDSTHMQLEKAWDITKGDTGTVIANLDFYLAWRHPDLKPTMWINSSEDRNGNGQFDPEPYPTGDLDSVDNDNDGYIDNVSGYRFNFYLGQPYIRCNPNPEPKLYTRPDTVAWAMGDPVLKHGAWTWSNAAAMTNNNSRGVAGTSFNSHVMAVGFNPWIPPAVPLCYLLQMKLQHGVPDVVNMSLGWGPAHNDSIILDSLYKLGVVLIAAAGNDGGDYANYPASHPKVMSVAATDSNDYRADFSTVNSTVDLSAPGFNYMAHHYFSADSNKAYGYRYAAVDSSLYGNPLLMGTSFSSPQVVGVASLVQSLFPNWSPSQTIAKLKSSTDPILINPGLTGDPRVQESTWIAQGKLGTGRLNAFKAVTFFGNLPGESVSDTTLSGTVYFSGDIKIRAGKTLRIAAGSVLKFYPGDVMKGGVDTTKEEIVVDSGGKLIVEGTSGSPVQLVSFKTSPGSQDWRGVVVKPGGSAKLFYAQIKHAYAGIDYQNSANDTVKNCLFDNTYMYGVKAKNGSLKILNNTFQNIAEGYGVYLDACDATVSNNTVTDCPYGINAYRSYGAITNNIITTTGNYIAYFGFRAEGSVPSPGTQKADFSYDSIAGIFDEAAVVANGGLAIDAGKIWPKQPSIYPDPAPQMIGILGLGTATTPVTNTTVKMFSSSTAIAPAVKVDGTPVLNLDAYCSYPCPDPPPQLANRIYRAGSSAKAVYNNTGTGVVARSNWWGTSSPSSSFFQGSVNWTSYLTSDPGPYWKLHASEENATLPLKFSLGQNYPNPFNPTTIISFSLPNAEKVRLKIYNILGQEVRTLLDEEKPAGVHQLIWDGKDGKGSMVSSGLYLYKLETASFKEVKRMTFLK